MTTMQRLGDSRLMTRSRCWPATFAREALCSVGGELKKGGRVAGNELRSIIITRTAVRLWSKKRSKDRALQEKDPRYISEQHAGSNSAEPRRPKAATASETHACGGKVDSWNMRMAVPSLNRRRRSNGRRSLLRRWSFGIMLRIKQQVMPLR